jgi:hypothetical protein
VVADLQRRHPGSDLDDDARALVAEDGREEPLGVGAAARELVGVANTGGLQLDEDLTGFGPFEIDFFDNQGFSGFVGDGGARFHGRPM